MRLPMVGVIAQGLSRMRRPGGVGDRQLSEIQLSVSADENSWRESSWNTAVAPRLDVPLAGS